MGSGALAGEGGTRGDRVAARERGQRVDEAKEIGLERGVAHGVVEHQALPERGPENAGRFPLEPAMQLAAEALNVVLEENVIRGGQGEIFRGGVHAVFTN